MAKTWKELQEHYNLEYVLRLIARDERWKERETQKRKENRAILDFAKLHPELFKTSK